MFNMVISLYIVLYYWYETLDLSKASFVFITTHFSCLQYTFLWTLNTQETVILTLSFTPSVSLFSHITFMSAQQPPQPTTRSLGYS